MGVEKIAATEKKLLKRIQELEEENLKLLQVAEQKQSDYEMLNKMIRRITDNAPDMIWAKDLDNRYLFANKALCSKLLMCKSTEAAIGKNDLYFAEVERSNGQRHTFGEVCVNSDEIVKAKEKAMRFIEDGLVRGQYLALDVHKAPLRDEAGKMVGTVGCGRNITHGQEMQKELAQSRISQQLIMDCNSGFAVFRLQVKTEKPRGLNVVFLSPSAQTIAGIKDSQNLDRWFNVHPDDRKALRYAIANGYKNQKINHRFRLFHAKFSMWRWLHIVATFAKEDKQTYINGIFFDITDQMKNDDAVASKGREPETRTDNLTEVNTALKVLLKKRDEDRNALEEKVLYNVKSLIRPYLLKMKSYGMDDRQQAYLEILESNLDEIVSPLSRKLSYDYLGFTPTEIKVATMVKQGKKAYEIARLLNISTRTVEGYRYSIRERLGIKGKKINLRTYLLSLQ